MSDKRFTFFELHLHDSDLQFGPKSIGRTPGTTGADEPEPSDTERAGESSGESSGESAGNESSTAKTGIAALLGLVLLVGIAVAVKKLTGEEPELDVLEELDELEDIEE